MSTCVCAAQARTSPYALYGRLWAHAADCMHGALCARVRVAPVFGLTLFNGTWLHACSASNALSPPPSFRLSLGAGARPCRSAGVVGLGRVLRSTGESA